MTNEQRILEAVERVRPDWISNAQLQMTTNVRPHQQIFHLTRKLMRSGHIRGELRGREWFFNAARSPDRPPIPISELSPKSEPIRSRDCSAFESSARTVLGALLGVTLQAAQLPNVPKRFDLVSTDGTIVGDAKYFDMVRGEATPPAKFSIIAEHVWLLEKTNARVKFLVFGNNPLVPLGWLKKYGHLVQSVSFLFLNEMGELEVLSDLTGAFTLGAEYPDSH